MAFVYVYSPTDFISALPDEAGNTADGSPPFVLTLSPTATPTIIEITDDDLILDEVDSTLQVLTSDVTIDGSFYAAGTTVNAAYDLSSSSDGITITSIHLGGTGNQQGPVSGIVSSELLTPGQTYTFDSEASSHKQDNAFTDYVACFVRGTLLETNKGLVPVEHLKPGDFLITYDRRVVRLRAKPWRYIDRGELAQRPNLRPVRITAGALANGVPRRDLLVSPQHRLLVNSAITLRMFGHQEVLVAAIHHTSLPGIYVDTEMTAVEYHHLVLDEHDIVMSEGVPSESLFPGPMTLHAMQPEALREIQQILPDLAQGDYQPTPARPIPPGRKQKQLLDRHIRNHKATLMPVRGRVTAL